MKIGQKSGKLDYYSISPIIRQILLYWGFDLRDEIVKLWQHTKKYFFVINIQKMNNARENRSAGNTYYEKTRKD